MKYKENDRIVARIYSENRTETRNFLATVFAVLETGVIAILDISPLIKYEISNEDIIGRAIDRHYRNAIEEDQLPYYMNITLEEKLESVRNYFEIRSNGFYKDQHIFVSSKEELKTRKETWKLDGEPHVWMLEENNFVYEVWKDVAYNQIILLKNGNAVNHGVNIITFGNVIVVDKNYFDVSKYLWF